MVNKKKEKVVNCFRCNNEILPLQKQVQIFTKDNGKILSEENFHFVCWMDFYNDSVKERLEKIRESVMSKAMQITKQLTQNLGLYEDG